MGTTNKEVAGVPKLHLHQMVITINSHVTEAAHLTTVPPEVVEGVVGADRLLECQVAGDPPPTTTWSRGEGAEVPWHRARLLEGRGLLIENIHPSDEGSWRCRAENRAGYAEGRVQLQVVAAPVLTVSPAPLLEVEEGGEVRLACLATGRPAPTLVWAKEGVTSVLLPGMSIDNVQVTAGGSLLIRNPDDRNSGVYTCSAVNRVGGTVARAMLRVGEGLPKDASPEVGRARDQLRELLVKVEGVEAVGSEGLEVTYSLLARPECLQGVLVHHRPSSERYSQYTTTKGDLGGHTIITGLQAETRYDVFLQPYCGKVGGLPTTITSATTDESEGVGETMVLVAEMINSTTAFIAWQPSTKKTIIGYEIELKNNDSSLSTQVSAAVSELYLGMNPADLRADFTVRVAILAATFRGNFSPPAKLSLPLGLPISVQPGLAETEDTAWLLLLLGSLALLLLLVASLLFYYRRRRKEEKRTGYLPAAVTDLDCRPGRDCLLWSGSDSGADSSTNSQKGLLRPSLSPYYRGASYSRPRPAPRINVPRLQSDVQSPYATTDLMHYHHHTRLRPLVELGVVPLLRSSGHRCRGSRSSDNLHDGEKAYAGTHRLEEAYAGVHRRRSNPNILDLLPPPPVTAPPIYQSREEVWQREGRAEVELALEQELSCFHETVTQFNQ